MRVHGWDTHTTNDHETGALGRWGADLMHCAGAGGAGGGEDGPLMRGMGGKHEDLLAGLQGTPNHPDRLLVGGLLGPRKGGARGAQRAEPRGRLDGSSNSIRSIRKTAPFVAILCIIIDRLTLCASGVQSSAHSSVSPSSSARSRSRKISRSLGKHASSCFLVLDGVLTSG